MYNLMSHFERIMLGLMLFIVIIEAYQALLQWSMLKFLRRIFERDNGDKKYH